ncbi:MAG: ATP-binding protein [Nitrososphaeria archaeon]|nr:ATP-binding protein [Nitrososphaeria archaeon]
MGKKIDYHIMLESLDFPIIYFDKNSNIKYWNRSAERLLGFKKNEVVGKNFESVLRPELYGIDFLDLMKRVYTTGQSCVRAVVYKKDYSPIYVELNVFRLKGKGEGSVVLIRDISLQKKLDEILRQSSLKLEALVEEKEKMLKDSERLITIGKVTSMIGHDLRNPLQTIINLLYLAKNDIKDKRLLSYFDRISEQVEYMHKIILDLQDFTTPVTVRLQSFSTEELFSVILRSVNIPENIIVVKNLMLKTIKTNWVSFVRIMQNLILNAVQAMPNGGTLTIEVFDENNFVVVKVSDTGVGIPKEHFDKIFEPYFTTKAKGMGLGLSVVKRLVDFLNGQVSFESEVGKGTTFTIKLPK